MQKRKLSLAPRGREWESWHQDCWMNVHQKTWMAGENEFVSESTQNEFLTRPAELYL